MEASGGQLERAVSFAPQDVPRDLDALTEIERKVLWLSTAIVDAANGPDRNIS